MRESKECFECGGLYFRAEHVTDAQWEARKYCSPSCAGKALSKRHKRAIEEGKAVEFAPEQREAAEGFFVQKEGELVRGETPEEMATTGFLKLDPVAAQTVRDPPCQENPPVMRELRIIRVGPNPRMVVCEYFELAQRRMCTVLVKRTQKWVRGMRFTMAEPKDEEAYRRPWVYDGKAPRWRGRW